MSPSSSAPAQPLTHTIDEALNRFTLIDGQGDGETTACTATALAWVAGLGHTDRLPCAHPTINSMVITANDDDSTTTGQRCDLVRAGETGMLDTWWVPSVVIAHCISVGRKDENGEPVEGRVLQTLGMLRAVTAWKQTHERIADLRYANLRYANLSSADLSYADLRYANLRYANLRYANLRYANLSSANLSSANLRSANLSSANLSYGAPYGNKYTILPDGWKVDENTGLIVAVSEIEQAS